MKNIVILLFSLTCIYQLNAQKENLYGTMEVLLLNIGNENYSFTGKEYKFQSITSSEQAAKEVFKEAEHIMTILSKNQDGTQMRMGVTFVWHDNDDMILHIFDTIEILVTPWIGSPTYFLAEGNKDLTIYKRQDKGYIITGFGTKLISKDKNSTIRIDLILFYKP